MRILLPPSEGKTAPPAGPRLDLAALGFPALTEPRRLVLGALADLCRRDPEGARHRLGLGPSLAEEVRRNAQLPDLPCAPAWQVYTGVLFGALDLGSLPPRARRSAATAVVIASGLFGLVGPDDCIPAYRLPGTVTLPGLASPKRVWSQALGEVLTGMAADHLIVDLRSQTYGALFRMSTARWVPIRVMTLREGRAVPVSHHNKATKGLVARSLVASGQEPRGPGDIVDLLRAAGWDADLDDGGGVELLT